MTSPVKKPSRAIPKDVTLFLYVQAGGRCEFDGCNDYLLEHYPTETVGNFAEQAHIYAFNESGPRGDAPGRPDDVNSLENLMLLCPTCHHLVDKVKPADYSVETLRRFKREHEDRIFALTGIAKDRDTVPLVLRGLVAGRPMDISDEEMQTAVAPDYLKRREKVEIDLTNIPDRPDAAFWSTAATSIDDKVAQLYRIEPRPGRTLRVSVFALAPMPLLVHLGSKLTDKIEVLLFQRHRTPESWRWNDGVGEARYVTRRLESDGASDTVALLVNLSGRNRRDQLPDALKAATVYELTLDGVEPSPLFLNTRTDLERFTAEYIRALALIRYAHPGLKRLHLFPAVPAPVAVTIGRMRLSKVDPPLLVYDRDHRAGGFTPTLETT